MKELKKNGVYYTPPILAEYLAKPLIKSNNQCVLDPSYGEGSLLLAAERIFKKKNKSSTIHLFGCDTKPVNGLLKHLPEANLKEIDFFSYGSKKMFQTILMNPPYVRHHIQDLEKIETYRSNFPELSILHKSADLWAYFLIKAIKHLQKGGNIGAILPWAFLQADYAIPLRKKLYDLFEEIKVVALSNKYFARADERVVLVWLKKFGRKCSSIQIASANSIEHEVSYSILTEKDWIANRVSYTGIANLEEIISKYSENYSFEKFASYADVKIGIVTGAVEYFIRSKAEAGNLGFKQKQLIPILTSSDEFAQYIKSKKRILKTLITLTQKDYRVHGKFINSGRKRKFHLRAHSKMRKPWYSVRLGKVPDAFFHYRITHTPYLLPNLDKIQSTNAIHRIYFKNITEIERKWIIVSILSAPSQLSLEMNSKTYGRGILKIEPKSLKNTIVVKSNDASINTTYDEVMNLLSSGAKIQASKVATDFIRIALNIPQELITATEEALFKFQELRFAKKKT